MPYRKRKYEFIPNSRQAASTFLVAYLFEGNGYVGRFDNRTGERIGTVNMADDQPETDELPEEDKPTNDKNQLSLF